MKSNRLYLSLLLLFPLALQADPYAYLANEGLGEVDVIDTATNLLVTRIMIPLAPGALTAVPISIAIAPNGTTVCTLNAATNTMGNAMITASVIDATLSVPALISTIQVTNTFTPTTIPTGIAYTTDSNSVYITDITGLFTGNVYSITDITGSQTVAQVTAAIIAPTAIAIGNTPSQTAYIGTYGSSGIYYMSIPGNTPLSIPNTGDSNTETLSIAVYGNTVYAVSVNHNGGDGILYQIVGNAVIQTINLGSGTPTGIVVSPDGNYLYITNNDVGKIVVIPTNDLSSSATFPSADAIALAITPDSKELFVTDESAEVRPYFVPAGTSAGSALTLSGGAARSSIVMAPLSSPASPSSVSGCKTSNGLLLQTDYINNITWTAPTSGSPAAYAIYRDATLTQLVAMVPATSPLQYYDHGRNPNVTYSYYIVSVDASGNQSAATSVTVTNQC